MMNRVSKDEYYLDIAVAVSRRSTCLKRHYGAVIVKDDVIIATGYNGSPRGETNCCDTEVCKRADSERYEGYEKCPAVHAEQNALLACDRSKTIGATLYLACEEPLIEEVRSVFSALSSFVCVGYKEDDSGVRPCNLCLRMIKNSGIARIVTREGDVIWG